MFCVCAAIAACTNDSTTENNEDKLAASDRATLSSPSEGDTSMNHTGANRTAESPPTGAYVKGAQLISASDCLGCHKEDQRLVGPSYQEIAKKYEANENDVNYLAGKIIKGGSGVWGEVPMSPHPAVSENDAKEMANYILSLD